MPKWSDKHPLSNNTLPSIIEYQHNNFIFNKKYTLEKISQIMSTIWVERTEGASPFYADLNVHHMAGFLGAKLWYFNDLKCNKETGFSNSEYF